VRRLIGLRAGALVVCSVLVSLAGLPAAAHAAASACHVLVVKPVGDQSPSSVLVTVPTALIGQELDAGNFTVSQGAESVEVQSVQRLADSRVDVAIVLDTAASAPDPAFARAQRFADSFLDALPPDVRVAVVSGGQNPTVLSDLSASRPGALLAVRQATRSPGHAGVPGVALAGDLLTAGPDTSRHVVLISTGTDGASQRGLTPVLSRLDDRGINVHAASVRGALAPPWGGQCPPTVGAGQEAGAGALLASRVSETYELVVAPPDPSAPVTVRVRSGPVDASAQLAALLAGTAVRGTRIEGDDPAGSGPGRILWVLGGLLLVALALGLGLYRLSPGLPGRSERPPSGWFEDTHTILLPPGPPSPESPPPPPNHPRD
jgi:hypothetical protein